jgi:ABC-type phosphate transport system substrate-binding protein
MGRKIIMRADRLRRLRAAAALAVTAVLGLLTFGPAQAAQATTYVPITGAGSTYAYPALNQWATYLEPQGLHINYTPNGSAQGRAQYIQNQLDYAGSDIAFLFNGDADPFGGVDTTAAHFAYSYIPDVAGGLSFMYNLQVDGHQITNLRLSGQTLAEIFTGHITNWDNPAITRDAGQQLPNLPITVVTRSDGAGESYFLTNWMYTEYRSLWVPFCEAHGGPPGCGTGPTEFFPGQNAGFKALSGSDTLSTYIASSANNGAIGYAEYAYAKEYHIPVVNMLNAAGYYVPPSAGNVAIALEQAQINPDENSVTFLMQTLNKVYTDPDPRAYPLSSYSYLIVPRDSRTIGGTTYHAKSEFNTAKGVTLSTYVNYILCGAQQTAATLGYSPLPGPMVNGGFLQESHIPGAVPNPAAHNYSGCNNPAYLNGVDTVTATAPYPSPCQKVGEPLYCAVVDGKATPTGPGGSGSAGSGSGGSGPGGTGPGGTGTTSCPSTPAASPTSSKSPHSTPSPTSTCIPGAGSGETINPNTGQVEAGGTQGQGPTANLADQPVAGIAGSPTAQWTFGILAAVVLLLAIAVPTGLGSWLVEAGGRRQRPWGGPPLGPQPPAPGGRPPASGPAPSAPPPYRQRPPEQSGTGQDA